MKRSNRNRNNQIPTPSEERDWVLTVLLAIINLGSGATTIMGAMQVLPRTLAWGLGGTIQLFLFLLLGEFTAKHAPFRKWVAVLVLTSISVYTSFFTYYKELAGEASEKLAHDRAALAHQKFVADLYTPMKDSLKQLEDEAASARVLAEAEKSRGVQSGLGGGYETEARKLDLQALGSENKAKNFKSTVEKLRPKFDYEIKGLKPNEILDKDRQALTEVPAERRQNYPELKREMYIDEELDVSLLAPYNKVKRLEEPALFSMGIALGVDGIAIMLGTAITIKRERKTLAQLIADQILKWKRGFAHVIGAIEETVDQDQLNGNAPQAIGEAVGSSVTLKLQGKGSQFLREFEKAIETREPHIINYQVLNNHPNPTFKSGFILLLNKLGEPGRAWVRMNSQNSWVVVPEHYHRLTKWLTEEIDHHNQEEAESELPEGWGFTDPKVADVTFRIPLINNSR
ncbi:MAG: hypothetical protein EAZ09_21790 [Oscillatoriales cyanobacterium]|nr:MAG: hypothetical protein EAZ18_18660 [Oscillatoriales cyanobacterium]TAH16399.1 MAG: hypothetical protein EAZ09_21790 [Oscillatoriales cyanobacterium]